MKTCRKCLEIKPISEFHRHSHFKADGHRATCKVCEKAKASTPEARARAVARTQKWQARNPDKVKAASVLDVRLNRASRNERSAAWRANNREYHCALVAAWAKANPEANAVYIGRRRARKAGNGGTHTLAEWRERIAYFNHCCAYCLRHESTCGKLTQEHVISLYLGGSDDIDNIVPACGLCNFKKGPRPLFKFLSLEQRNAC